MRAILHEDRLNDPTSGSPEREDIGLGGRGGGRSRRRLLRPAHRATTGQHPCNERNDRTGMPHEYLAKEPDSGSDRIATVTSIGDARVAPGACLPGRVNSLLTSSLENTRAAGAFLRRDRVGHGRKSPASRL